MRDSQFDYGYIARSNSKYERVSDFFVAHDVERPPLKRLLHWSRVIPPAQWPSAYARSHPSAELNAILAASSTQVSF
jgi:hypothetical protein